MRDRAAQLVAEIPQNLRDYTVHDITHLDALWETASLVAGSDYSLNPLEGFVLGGAILLHDAGMALVAYPLGLKHSVMSQRGSMRCSARTACYKGAIRHPTRLMRFPSLLWILRSKLCSEISMRLKQNACPLSRGPIQFPVTRCC
jgi:hypothetical protein